jgi:ABC-type multidrug transport system permease subunit
MTWPIVKLTIGHCGGALIMGGAFSGTGYLLGLMFPNDVLRWWIQQVDFVLAIVTTTALGLIFLNLLCRIVFDAIVSTWKGFPNVNGQGILA